MFHNIFQLANDIALPPLLALIVFVAFFLFVILWIIRMDKRHVRYMEQLPLDQPTAIQNNGGNES